MFDFIERLRAKPEHVRKRIAVGTASGLTGLVAVGWIAALVAGNGFILKPTPFADSPTLAESAGELTASVSEARNGFTDLMGEASEPNLVIIEGDTSSTIDTGSQNVPDDRRVIPF